MRNLFTNKTSVCNVICGVLLLVLLVLQFTPFWSFGDPAETASIQQYVWRPEACKDLTKHLDTALNGEHDVLYLAAPGAIVLLGGVIGGLVVLFRSNRRYASSLPIIVGVTGVYAYLCKPALQLGSGWVLHLIVSVALAAAGVYAWITATKEAKAA